MLRHCELSKFHRKSTSSCTNIIDIRHLHLSFLIYFLRYSVPASQLLVENAVTGRVEKGKTLINNKVKFRFLIFYFYLLFLKHISFIYIYKSLQGYKSN